MRLRKAASATALLLAVCGCVPASAQDQGSLPSLSSVLQKNGFLREGKRVPFRLKGGFRITKGLLGYEEGSFDLVWVSSSQWREDITFGDYKESRFAKNAKDYWSIPTNKATTPIEVNAAIRLLRKAAFLDVASDVPKRKKAAGGDVACFGSWMRTEACVDPTSARLVPSPGGPQGVYEFTLFQSFGDFVVPAILRQKYLDRKTEAWIDTVSPLQTMPEPGWFQAGPGATEITQCQTPEPPKVRSAVDPEYPSDPYRGKDSLVVVRLGIGTDGKPFDVEIQRSGGKEFDKEALRTVKRWRFKPAECDGKAIPMTINIEVNFNLVR